MKMFRKFDKWPYKPEDLVSRTYSYDKNRNGEICKIYLPGQAPAEVMCRKGPYLQTQDGKVYTVPESSSWYKKAEKFRR